MGLLDATINNVDKKITRGLVTDPEGLAFESINDRLFQITSEHFFKKDMYIEKNGFNVYIVSGIKLPAFFHTGDEVEVSVSFSFGHYMDVESQIYISIFPNKIEPMKFKTNLYELIKMFLDEDNIIGYLTDRLKLNLIQ